MLIIWNARQKEGRGGGVRKCSNMLALSFSCLMTVTTHAYSTVLEYDSNGDVSITDKSHIIHEIPKQPFETSIKAVAKPDKAFLRKLTREVATKYSGSIGVRAAGIDAMTFIDVFEALIGRESNFDPNTLSPKGAAGLGQLMPATATELGVSDPFDPVTNLHGSARYLTQQLESFGSVDIALAAYNAGPKRVREYNGVPPFDETKSYIKWILAKAGLKPGTTVLQVTATSKDQASNLNTPLKGIVSVWEF